MEHIKSQSQGMRTTDRDHGHEDSDINVKAIFGFGVFLVLSAIVVHVALWWMYRFLDHRAEMMDAPETPVVQQMREQMRGQKPERKSAQSGQVGEKHAETAKDTLERLQAQFPTPRLQDDDVRDMNMLRSSEEQLLNHYTWIDKNSGTVRLPVARAMEIIAERGLPNVAPETAQSKAAAAKATTAKPATPAKQ